nr:MAG TPA: hypothetical protein [Caudoviricetes sp.]
MGFESQYCHIAKVSSCLGLNFHSVFFRPCHRNQTFFHRM